MSLRLAVGGLLVRDAVLGTLLLNYADRLEHRRSGCSAPCFIVPGWSGRGSADPPESELFTVEAHTSVADPRREDNLDAILRLLHAVLTDGAVDRSITARRVGTSPKVHDSGLDTVFRVGTWAIAPAAARRVLAATGYDAPPSGPGGSRR
jgi:hypothetical protein